MVLENCLHMNCRSIIYNRIWPDWGEIRPRSIWIYENDIMAWLLEFDEVSLKWCCNADSAKETGKKMRNVEVEATE